MLHVGVYRERYSECEGESYGSLPGGPNFTEPRDVWYNCFVSTTVCRASNDAVRQIAMYLRNSWIAVEVELESHLGNSLSTAF